MKKLIPILLILTACKPTIRKHLGNVSDSLKTIAKTYTWCADQLDKAVADDNTSAYDRKEFQQIQIRFLDSAAMYNRLSEEAK